MPNEMDFATIDPSFHLSHLCQYFSERSPHPMLAVEGSTCIVRHVNAAFLDLAGVNRSDVIGRPFALAVPEGESNGCVGLLDRVFRTGTHEGLAEQRHGDALPVYWSYAVWAILGIDKLPVGVMIQVTDTTEIALFRTQAAAMNGALMQGSLRQIELTESAENLNEQLLAEIAERKVVEAALTKSHADLQAQAREVTRLNASLQVVAKEREYFIAVLSHELRTPLNPVLLATSILQQDQRSDADTRQTMQMIHRNIMLEARLIDDLLDMTRMERGKLNLIRRPVDLREVIEAAAEVCKADLDAGQLRLLVESGIGPLIVDADASRLQQVFSNLLRNSIKFTPAGGSIVVRSRRDGDSYLVEVNDSGVGMDAEFLPRAFSAFEQGDRNAGKEGLGLGLAICKTIVELHGGTITADSEGKNRGATFVVRLPALVGVPTVPTDKDTAGEDLLRAVKPLRILLVEDHADTARIMRRLLALDGHEVQWAGDVATALKLVATDNFDLLLSDVGLPDGTGLDLMRTLRQGGSTLPGIVLSGYGQDEDVARSRDAGFAAHLVKPLTPQMLRDAIISLIH